MRTEFYSSLSQNFSQLLDDADDYNVTIKVGEDQDTQEFRAHSMILRARSPYFKSALSNQWANNKKDGMILFTKPNISPLVFTLILKYIYTGVLDLTNIKNSDILELLVASDELLLEELMPHIQNYLLKKETVWLTQNFVEVLFKVSKLLCCKQLQEICLGPICADPEPFFASKNFPNLDKDSLLELIKRDDLGIEEIDLWDHLIKWGISQIPKIKQKDFKKFSDSNFRDLRKTLESFIPYIRFYEISLKDFFNKVRPYKKLLPESLHKDIMSFVLTGSEPKYRRLPARLSYIDLPESKIINKRHAAIISKWISEITVIGERYEFQLLYRGSRDGYNIGTFYSKVNGRGHSIAVIKIKDSEKIIGGFNASGWNYEYYNYTGSNRYNYSRYNNYNRYNNYKRYTDHNRDHFIFSFGENYEKKIGKLVEGSNGIYYGQDHMLEFGDGDLRFDGRNGSCNQSCYDQSIMDVYNFVAEEMEVFSVSVILYLKKLDS
ncbi:hypothetical protein Glove_85g108 [Diversispora epigaea]|uniref:BTB domain-containing protein n=1 Tax=Diversispora epigaea TaxID=1348612 RepID=A0A397JDR6_9GLOM|nr:hypothetical protein Glove_85g108 [Diversispora epigaea]